MLVTQDQYKISDKVSQKKDFYPSNNLIINNQEGEVTLDSSHI